MGLTDRQVLRRLEVPLALAVIIAGIGSAAVQIIATVTLGAIFGFGGLGAYLTQGISQNDDGMVFAGSSWSRCSRSPRRRCSRSSPAGPGRPARPIRKRRTGVASTTGRAARRSPPRSDPRTRCPGGKRNAPATLRTGYRTGPDEIRW